MNRGLAKLLFLAFVAGWSGSCSDHAQRGQADRAEAEDPVVRREFGAGPVKLTITLSSDSITTADVLTCEMALRVDNGFKAEFPDLAFPADVPGMILTHYEQSEQSKESYTLEIREYELEPEFHGSFGLPALDVYYHRRGQVREEMFETDPIAWTVTETPATAEMLELRPFRGLITVEQIKAERRRTWPWVVGGIAGTVVLVLLVLFLVRRPRPTPPPIPAHETALEALRALAADDLIAKGQVEPFFVRITSIVRDYIESAFGLRAPEQTTQEFLANITAAPVVAGHRDVLEPFLTAADEVKFARAKPETTTIQCAFDTARDFIVQTSSTERGVA